MMFAVITPALITGATADRLKFSSYALFIALWSLIVYSPVAHWVWDGGGWIFDMGALDFAGGAAIHINAGIAALAVVAVIGQRRGPRQRADAAPQPAADRARHRHPLVRLVRVQRRLGARRRRRRRPGAGEHAPGGGGGDARLVDRRTPQDRSRDDARCLLGRRRRTRGDHTLCRLTWATCRPSSSA